MLIETETTTESLKQPHIFCSAVAEHAYMSDYTSNRFFQSFSIHVHVNAIYTNTYHTCGGLSVRNFTHPVGNFSASLQILNLFFVRSVVLPFLFLVLHYIFFCLPFNFLLSYITIALIPPLFLFELPL